MVGTNRAALIVAIVALLVVAGVVVTVVVTSGQDDTGSPETAQPDQTTGGSADESSGGSADEGSGGGTSGPGSGDSASGPEEVVLRPFATGGGPAAGWSIEPSQSNVNVVDCSYPSPSPASKSPGIQSCSPAAAGADACFFARGSTSGLCLQDPFSTTLARVEATGSVSYDLAPPTKARPLGLLLDDGTACRLRNGGAWSGQVTNPAYVGYYSCHAPGSSDWIVVWGDPSDTDDGITRSAGSWTVQVGDSESPLTTRVVQKAYYVGTA